MLAEEISRRLNLPCELFDPLSLLEQKRVKSNNDGRHHYAYSTAVGLALRGLNWLEHKHAA